jgi:hypothetical protein
MDSGVCFVNIGPRERKKRMTFGVLLLGAALVGSALALTVDLSRPYRLLLLLPFWAGALGVFQARAKT